MSGEVLGLVRLPWRGKSSCFLAIEPLTVRSPRLPHRAAAVDLSLLECEAVMLEIDAGRRDLFYTQEQI